jgi:hypothetical protein
MELTPEERSQQLADANLNFEDHGVGRGSKLEPHRVAIVEMRRCRWPYRRVVEWIQINRKVSATAETVRSFCRVRGIRKGASATQRVRARGRQSGQANNVGSKDSDSPDSSKCEFDFDESLPMETWKTRTGKRKQ